MEPVTSLEEGNIWREARSIFGKLMECDAAERAELMEQLCSGKVELKELLKVLLRRYESADSGLLPMLGKMVPECDDVFLAPGTRLLGRFVVESMLGKGGMSSVYLAKDQVLDQRVALKILRSRLLSSEAARDRFLREVARSREVSHPNVCRVYEWFEGEADGVRIPFLIMEWVEGESLADWLNRGEERARTGAVEILRQLAAGLDEIHRRGIVHLDLKPGNVLLAQTRAGDLRVVILDFGLATLREGIAEGGTPGFMAPEQFLGGEVSAAADVYALGFLAAALDPSARGPRKEAVQRATQAAPELRQASAGQFFREWSGEVSRRRLMRAGAASAVVLGGLGTWRFIQRGETQLRLALLPFEVSPGSLEIAPEQVKELTAQSTQHLLAVPRLAVAGSGSVFSIAANNLKAEELGQRLAADVLAQPTLTRKPDGWQVSVRVLDLRKGKVLGANTVALATGKMAEVPSRVAGVVLGILGMANRLVTDSRGVLVNEEAYGAYLEGRHLWGKRTPRDLREALTKFQKCLDLAPYFGQAESGMADCLCALADQGEMSPAATRLEAMGRARRGVELEPGSAVTRASLGIALSLFEYDLAGARRELEAAIALDAGYAPAHQWLSAVHLKSGQWQQCLHEVDVAYENDRLGYPTLRAQSAMRYFLRDYSRALSGFLELDRLLPGQRVTAEYLAECYARLGRPAEARHYAGEALRLSNRGAQSCVYASIAHTLSGDARTGRTLAEEAAAKFRTKEFFQPVHLARVFAELLDIQQAEVYLAECSRVRDTGLPMLLVHQSFDKIRDTQSFQAALVSAAIRYPDGKQPNVLDLKEKTAQG
jgi:tRNA A-37 threonylcarbamoyl transferase component Bud32/tetratricopeptide (TPR) repeat protein